jgi:hypothetical protein
MPRPRCTLMRRQNPVHDADIDGGALGREHRLVEVAEPILVDHEVGSSTSKSTSIP